MPASKVSGPAPSRRLARALGLALLLACSALAGCSHLGRRTDPNRYTAETLYRDAHKAMDSSDYELSVKLYEALAARFPFSDQARQARLDLIYVYYRKGENETATDAAEQFLRENPTHPRIDYAWYMKGLIDYEHTPWAFERWFGVDMAKRPPASLASSITAFTTVVKQFPKSEYAHDAQRRLIYLRNRLAEYEINVARYYVRRGAYDAAAQRAQRTIEQYDGAPAVRDALAIMIDCYKHLGLKDLQANTEKVYQANYGEPSTRAARRSAWWRFW
ncbi:MAG: outer membrane protein assembly factor BamD [Gammaproteobacteria bacterium]|nr:outer membrane protein assembly factor BamD [Gammaproteobacteria bacterium]MDE2249911.1 outer membrane protein assembly factor BamD [Gammaproteobacteria bacterium]